jgi:uncharacterized repeat protein (TIGR02543 family)
VSLSALDGDELVFDNVFLGGNPPAELTVDPSQTQLGAWNFVEGYSRGAASVEQASSDSVTMSWIASADSMWVTAAVPINPAMVEPPTCYALTLSSGSNGDDPTADPANSWGCSPGMYSEGESIDLTAHPDPGYKVSAWSGTNNDLSVELTNHLTMPALSEEVLVLYELKPITPEVLVDGPVSSETMDDADSISFSHTTGTGENRFMLVGVSWNCGTNDRSISSVQFSYDSTVLDLDPVITEQTGTQFRYASIWSLEDVPGPGQTGTVTVTFNDPVSNGVVAGAINFSGVDPITPIETSNGANENSDTPSVSLSGLDGDELVFDNVFQGASGSSQTLTLPPGSGQTEQWNAWIANVRAASSVEPADSASSVDMNWQAESDSYWAITAVALNPAPAPEVYELIMGASPSAGGSITPETGIHSYFEGTVVDISAEPAPGYEFVSWTGDVANPNAADTTVTMDDDKSVTANFALIEYPLNINIVGNGAVTKDPDLTTFHYGDSVELTAVADSGWVFFGWSDDLGGSDNPETIVMDGEKTVTATFVEGGIGEVLLDGAASHGTANEVSSMSFAHTSGSGNDRFMLVGVSWNSGESAKDISSVVFSYGSTELTFSEVITEEVMVSGTVSGPRYAAIYRSDAQPPAGTAGTIEINFDTEVTNGIVAGAANFEGVNQTTPLGTPIGDNGDSSGDPVLNLTGLTGVEMIFDTVFLGGADDSYTLSVGAGQTELWNDFSGNARGTASYEPSAGSSVEMSWTPTQQNWWAAVAVPINPAAIGPTYDLTMAVSPSAGGSTLPVEGTHSYAEDTVVDISAIPATGYVFDSWSGDVAEPSNADTTVTMTDDKTVTANFVPAEYTLTVNVVGNGTVTKDPDQATYEYGDSVELTANPASGWLFSGWSGDLAGMINPDTVNITGDTTVTATFVEDVPGTIIYLGDVGSGSIKEESADLTITTDAPVAEGDAIIISYAIGPHPDLEVTVTDSVGNTYEQIELARSYEYGRSYIFATFNVTALPAGSEIVLTSDIGSGGEFPYPSAKAAVISVFRGLGAIEVVDQTLGNPTYESESAVSSSNPSVGPTGTTSQDNELVVAAIGTNGPVGDAPGTWQNDFINGQRVGTSGGDAQDNWTVSMGYKIVNTTGAFTAQKNSTTDRYFAAVIATFKAQGEINEAPVVSIPDQSIPEGSSFATIDLDAYVDDPDNLDEELTWSTSGNTDLTVDIDENRIATVGIPNPDWFGSEVITFTAEDPGGETGSDAATFEVRSENDPPVVSDIPDQTIDEGQSFATISLDDYVEDVEDADADISWSYADNTQLTVSITDRVATITTPGSGWSGSETITFTAEDLDGGTDDDSATFTVNAVNDPPVVSDIPDQTIDEGQSFATISLDDYVEDSDNADSEISWSFDGNVELSVSIVDRVATIGIPSINWFGAETITFTAEDPGFESDSDDATFTVTAVNDPPVVSDIPDQTIDEGDSFLTIALDDYVEDIEDADADISWSFADNTDLTVSITDRVATITVPDADWSGSETITFTAQDLDGGTDDDSATFTVNAVNDPPVVSDIPDQNVAEGVAFDTIDLDDFVNDVDNADDEITWTSSGETELSVSIVDRVATITAPSAFWSGVETITFTAGDPGGETDSDSATFTVTAVVEPPVVEDIPDQEIEEGDTFTTIALDDYVSDPDHTDKELVWTYSNNTDLLVDIDENRIATITTPDGDWFGAEMITFTATDPDSVSDSDNATFTITAVNDPPVVDDIPNQTIAEGGSFVAINLDTYVDDVDNPDAEISWTASGQVELTINIIGHVATISLPGVDWNGSETITFTAEDPEGETDSDSAIFAVTSDNDPPVLGYIPDKTIDETLLLTFIASATDVDEPPQDLNFYLDDGLSGTVPAGAEITMEGGVFGWTPTEAQGPDEYTFDVCVSDGELNDCETVNVTVNEVNLAPSLDLIGDKEINEGSELGFTAAASDADLPAPTLTFSLAAGSEGEVPAGASINPDSGLFSWTPTEAQGPGVFTFDVCVSDGEASDCETIDVTVGEVNVLPSLVPVGDKSVDEGSPLTFLVVASDPDLPEQDLVFNLSNSALGDVPVGASISADGHFEWTPLESQGPGTYNFNVCVSDGGDQSVCGAISIEVVEVNEPPVLDPIGNKVVMETEELTFTATASDPDIPAQDLSFSLDEAPDGAAIDPVTGVFSWAPTSDQAPDTYTFDVCVSDGTLSDCETIEVEATEYVPKTCYALNIDHSGYGTDPIADPPNSEGCPVGEYEPGVSISLLDATPDEGWHIAAWEGTEDDGSKGEDNLIIMPESDADIMVKYETYLFLPMIIGGK